MAKIIAPAFDAGPIPDFLRWPRGHRTRWVRQRLVLGKVLDRAFGFAPRAGCSS